MDIEIGLTRKPDGALKSFVDFSVLNRRVENEEQAFALARLLGQSANLLDALKSAEASLSLYAATLRAAPTETEGSAR